MSEPDAPPSGATAPTAPSGPAPDRLFAGRYRLTGRRGTGLDIALFEAVDVLGDRTVAVKIIHPDICAQPGFDDRFTDTVHRVASVRHPNVAEILDIGAATWNGQPVHYVVCENLTGGSLRDLRDRGRSLSPSQVVMVGLDVCRGLDAAHRAGLVHGDIRPANLVFGDDGRLRITDLGLAHLVSDEIWANPASVSTDRARYASPEQAVGAPPEAKSDVYSLCLCLLEAVTGQLPFIGDSTVATLQNRVDRLMPVSADLGPLAAVLERAGRPVADDRFTAAEFGRSLVQAAERLPRPARIELLGTGLFADAPVNGNGNGQGSGSGDETTVLAAVRPTPPAPAIAATAVVPVAPPPSLDPALTVPAAAVPVGVAMAVAAVSEPAVDVPGVPANALPLDVDLDTDLDRELDHHHDADADLDIPPPPQPPPPLLRHSTARRRLLLVLVIILVAAALGGALAWMVGRDQANDVPDLVGLDKGAALNMVSEFGWIVTTTEEPSDDIAAGSVMRTDPAAGARLDEGAEFLIVVSSGPAPRTLPELVGLTVDQATAALTALGLVIEQGEPVNDDLVPAGTIVSWTVPVQTGLRAGDTVLPNTTVRLVVSAGPAPRVVPELAGLSLPDATAQLQALGLTVVQGADEFSDAVPIGAVLRIEPAAGTQLPIGSPVTIVLSKGTEFVVVPPLADLTLQQASDALLAAGLVLGEVNGDPAGVNILAEVDGVSIGANASFPRGTAIDLTFGQPPPPTTVPPDTTSSTSPPA